MDFKRTRRIITILFGFILLLLRIPSGSEAGVSVIGGLSHERIVGNPEIGTTYQGSILISNTGEEPQEVKVYQTDYLFFFDGRNLHGEPGKITRSNADWITFSPKRLVIPPKGTSKVNYTLKVPADETLVGTHWSMLMVEGISKGSPEVIKPEEGKVKLGIRTVLRYGIQMITHIGDTGARKLKFLNTRLLKQEERKILQVDIENVGERWLRPFLWTELYDQQGRYIGKFQGGRLRTYPGTSVRFRVDLSQVPKGEYKALVVADCGGDDVFGATYTLKFGK